MDYQYGAERQPCQPSEPRPAKEAPAETDALLLPDMQRRHEVLWRVEALDDFDASAQRYLLCVCVYEELSVLGPDQEGWTRAENDKGQRGWVPTGWLRPAARRIGT
eukprot:Skav221234  [mRNA]  locus=scaffold1136:202176:205579:+ [translate_table: standard]